MVDARYYAASSQNGVIDHRRAVSGEFNQMIKDD